VLRNIIFASKKWMEKKEITYLTPQEIIEFNIQDDPSHAKIMTGIRENYYTDIELKEWIKDGHIREFKRH
jgi:hypothetical protein